MKAFFEELRWFFGYLWEEFLRDVGIKKEMEFLAIGGASDEAGSSDIPFYIRADNLDQLKKRFQATGEFVSEDENTIKVRVFQNKDQFVVISKAGNPVKR